MIYDNFAATSCFKVGKCNCEKLWALTRHKSHITVTASIIAKEHLDASWHINWDMMRDNVVPWFRIGSFEVLLTVHISINK